MMAKDLIRTRHQIEKFYKLKSQLQGVALRIQVHSAFFFLFPEKKKKSFYFLLFGVDHMISFFDI